MEYIAGDLSLQQHFPYKTSKFSENSNCRINLLFHSRGSNLAILVFQDLKISGKIWSRDPSWKGPILMPTGKY